MKNNAKKILQVLAIFVLSVGFSYQGFGQRKVTVSTGIGLPELLNIGVRYQISRTQIGMNIGTWGILGTWKIPTKDENIMAILGDVRYHFGRPSKLSGRHPWYVRFGLGYMRYENTNLIEKDLLFVSHIGLEADWSKKFGIEMGVGVMGVSTIEEIRKTPPSFWEISLNTPIAPSLGIGLYYRL